MDKYTIKSKTNIYTENEVARIDDDIENILTTNPLLQVIFSEDDITVKTKNFNGWNVRYDKDIHKFKLIDPDGKEEGLVELNNMCATVTNAKNFEHLQMLMMEDFYNYLFGGV